MGCFSWLDCVTKKQIRISFYGKRVYVLVPKEFGGGHIIENSYDGYGNFGGYDIYELVAFWNRKHLKRFKTKEPHKKEKYMGLYSFEIEELKEQGKSDEEIALLIDKKKEAYYQAALSRYENQKALLESFISAPDNSSFEELQEMFGDSLRVIGIDIACDNKNNKNRKYPIKITYDENAVYEDCKYSLSDPYQGL